MLTTELRVQRFLTVVCALLAVCALAVMGHQSVNDLLGLDELFTTSLLSAATLPKLWKGIVVGLDGNPPLFMTAAWLIIQPLPKLVSSVATLKLVNLVAAAAGVVALGQLARRIVSPAATWIGALLFVTLSNGFVYDASVLRTYALYFLAAALAALCQQRLIERRRPSDIAWLALANVALAMSHTFGSAYVGIIALAGWLSRPRGDKTLLVPMVMAVAPAVLTVAAWSPFLMEQLQVANPYGWMVPPVLSELLDSVFGSVVMLWISIFEAGCLVAAGLSALKRDHARLRAVIHDPAAQPLRFVVLLLAGITGFTLLGWLISRTVFPLFVVRYFTPQLFAAYALHVAFGEWLLRHRLRYRTAIVAICAVLMPLVMGNVALRAHNSVHGADPCVRPGGGRFFEENFVDGKLPVIVDSTHMFLPRLAFAAHSDVYRFALDWEVVLKYPNWLPDNASDFHLMQNLQTWRPEPQVVTTDDILKTYPQFLVIAQRAWFFNLQTTHQVTAEKLAEVISSVEGESSCTLWKVTRVGPRE
jgi:hypothetical protein